MKWFRPSMFLKFVELIFKNYSCSSILNPKKNYLMIAEQATLAPACPAG